LGKIQLEKKPVGWEIICESKECINNDMPVCKIHKPDMPIVIKNGQCQHYKKKDGRGWFYDELKTSSRD
jgi:hypothetical protein